MLEAHYSGRTPHSFPLPLNANRTTLKAAETAAVGQLTSRRPVVSSQSLPQGLNVVNADFCESTQFYMRLLYLQGNCSDLNS